MPNPDPTIERLKERAWQDVAATNQALLEGRIDEEENITDHGFIVHGRVEIPHQKDSRVVRRLFWIDKASI